MKKIIMIAAIIAASIAANAATFKWSAGQIYASNGVDKFTGNVTLYAYLASGDANDAFEVSTVTASSTGVVASTTFTDDRLRGGNDYNFYFIIEDNGKVFKSVEKTGSAALTQTVTLAFGNMATATKDASNWSAVPEPTSAMLLVLGVAALALRRKRA